LILAPRKQKSRLTLIRRLLDQIEGDYSTAYEIAYSRRAGGQDYGRRITGTKDNDEVGQVVEIGAQDRARLEAASEAIFAALRSLESADRLIVKVTGTPVKIDRHAKASHDAIIDVEELDEARRYAERRRARGE
jgi:hypothetical protein